MSEYEPDDPLAFWVGLRWGCLAVMVFGSVVVLAALALMGR